MLEGLLDENDQDPNVWLLLAMCCQGGGDEEGALGAGAGSAAVPQLRCCCWGASRRRCLPRWTAHPACPLLAPVLTPPAPHAALPRPAVEEGIEVCKRLGLPKEDDTYAGLEALQEGLQTLLKEAAKEGGKEDK